MLIFFQIIFVLFSLFAISMIWKKRKEGLLGPKGSFFWFLFWLLSIVVVVWPNITGILASKFGIGRGVDFALYFAVLMLFYIIFRLHIKIESIGRDLTKIVRKLALEDVKKHKD